MNWASLSYQYLIVMIRDLCLTFRKLDNRCCTHSLLILEKKMGFTLTPPQKIDKEAIGRLKILRVDWKPQLKMLH